MPHFFHASFMLETGIIISVYDEARKYQHKLPVHVNPTKKFKKETWGGLRIAVGWRITSIV